MAISSIDELLMGGSSSQQPMSPEEKLQTEPETIEEMESESPDYEESPKDDHMTPPDSDDDFENEPKDDHTKDIETDEYGNTKEPENEAIRERLARQARKHQTEIDTLRAQLAQQGASQPVQQAVEDFEYDPNAQGDWQQQLASFVKQTVNSMSREQEEAQKRHTEERSQTEFREKFRSGMEKFEDFVEVVSSQPLDDAMTIALRGFSDPAAFIYAAAKRNPEELTRISKLSDPYARIVEMGKLEERMRRNKPTTKAPRPLGRTQEDATSKVTPKQKDTSGDDLLAKADARRLNTVNKRLKGNR